MEPHAPRHIPVLLDEVVRLLAPRAGETYLDCTAGLGGHAAAIAPSLGPSGAVVLMDLDEGNLAHAAARLRALPDAPRVHTFHANFTEAPRLLEAAGLAADLALADLGFASPQVDDPTRGLSFSRDGPLDMRLNPAAPVTAAELVNTMSAAELAEVLREYGEEPAARTIAQKIVEARKASPIHTTARLAEIIRSAVPRIHQSGRRSIDPATRTFQALRIAVNDELGSLGAFLSAVQRAAAALRAGAASPRWLSPEARLGIITFHSLEDRPVKQAFASLAEHGLARDLSRGHIGPTDIETQANPRARSAKLRVVQFGVSSAAAE